MLKAVVIGLGVLIVIGLLALVAGVVQRMGVHRPRPAGPGVAYALPKGAQILEMHADTGRLILRVRTEAGEEVDILDTQDGHLVARIR
jgi:Family of unknown function (DUF6476)